MHEDVDERFQLRDARRLPAGSGHRAQLAGEPLGREPFRLAAGGEAEWTRHLGRTATAQLRRALTKLREITDPYQ